MFMVGIFHLCFQLLTGFTDVLLHLLPLLFLHFIKGLPALRVFKLKAARTGKSWRLLPFPEKLKPFFKKNLFIPTTPNKLNLHVKSRKHLLPLPPPPKLLHHLSHLIYMIKDQKWFKTYREIKTWDCTKRTK